MYLKATRFDYVKIIEFQSNHAKAISLPLLEKFLLWHLTQYNRVVGFNSYFALMASMKDGDRCEICSVVYGTESRIEYKPVGKSNFRFQCEENNRDYVIHKFTIDGKLHRRTKRIYNSDRCPVCAYPSGIVGAPKTGAFCHVCDAKFRLERNIVILTGLGKFTRPPDWFNGRIEIE